jgi:hypothetical protein
MEPQAVVVAVDERCDVLSQVIQIAVFVRVDFLSVESFHDSQLALTGLTPGGVFLPGKSTIERCRRADQSEMRKRLREVPEAIRWCGYRKLCPVVFGAM